jgi:hypothetical protein
MRSAFSVVLAVITGAALVTCRADPTHPPTGSGPPSSRDPRAISLLFGGDVMLGRGVRPVARFDPAGVFAGAHLQVVEIGTGRVDTIYVIVPDDHGGFQLAQGAVYSYYEFLQPLSNRLTDEAWRAMLDAGQQPDRPVWEGVFLSVATS